MCLACLVFFGRYFDPGGVSSACAFLEALYAQVFGSDSIHSKQP